MTALRLDPHDRLAILGAAVQDLLNSRHSEGELENDGELADLYNLAAACEESGTHPREGAPAHEVIGWTDRVRHADDLATTTLVHAEDASGLGRQRERILAKVTSA